MPNLNSHTMKAYKQKVIAQIEAMKARMQMLEAHAANVSADMHVQFQKTMYVWRPRFEDIEKKVDKLSETSEESLGDLRSDIENELEELDTSIRNAAEDFEKQTS